MKRKHIQSILEECEKQVLQVSDPASVAVITTLFNLVESLVEQTDEQAQQIQTLKDEINHTKANKVNLSFANSPGVTRMNTMIIPQKKSVKNANLKSRGNPVARRNRM